MAQSAATALKELCARFGRSPAEAEAIVASVARKIAAAPADTNPGGGR
jgi:pyrimidine deaminase RibD-like protein